MRTVLLILIMTAGICGSVAGQGMFLERGQSAILVDANAGFDNDNHGAGVGLGFSFGSYLDLGAGARMVGGSGISDKIGFSQYLSLNLVRQSNKSGTVFGLSITEKVVPVPRAGYYPGWNFGGSSGPNYRIYMGGRAVWQIRSARGRVAPFVSYGWQDISSADRDSFGLFELGIAIIRSGQSGIFVISPSVGFGNEETFFDVTLTFNLFSGGEASGGQNDDEWGS
jgi:hypothetical protein